MQHFDNRGFRIQYDSWGDPSHQALLFFHGFPGSHVQARAIVPLLKEHKLRMVACDRPGYGGTVGVGTDAQYSHAVLSLLEHLQIDKFHILAVSGGSPFAHMMASLFAEKIRSLSVVCGLATYNKETSKYFSKMQKRALLARKMLPQPVAEALLNNAPIDPDRNYTKILTPLDLEIMRNPENAELLKVTMSRAKAQGAKGIARDAGIYHRDWLRQHCDVKRLSSVPVFYFHGIQDRILNHEMSHWMHKNTHGSTLKYFDEEGHYSLAFRQASYILNNINSVG